MGLLDYYRQFEGLSEEEVNRDLREQAAERRRKALTRVQILDLTQTTWPELPHPDIVAAITFVARRGLHSYSPLSATALLDELAARHAIDRSRLIVGNGAAQLLSAAARALLAPGDHLITPWPSYPLFPIMAHRARAQAVPVSGDLDAVIEAVTTDPRARVVAIASPNDPTGELLPVAGVRRLLGALPRDVAVLLDESLVDFVDAQPIDASLALLEDSPQLLIFRSFSKAWGLAGLRLGYAIGAPTAQELLAELAPDLGVSEVSQAGALEAIRSCSGLIAGRVALVARERARLTAALRDRDYQVSDSQANFLWVAHPTLHGGELTARLAQAGILIAAGDALGEPRHVRISIRDAVATDRLLEAIDQIAG